MHIVKFIAALVLTSTVGAGVASAAEQRDTPQDGQQVQHAALQQNDTLRQDEKLILNELQQQRLNLRVSKDYALGLTKYHLDHETEMLGWKVSESVYFGRQRGEDSGLTLVWQQQNNQVSLSRDGLRLTRRF